MILSYVILWLFSQKLWLHFKHIDNQYKNSAKPSLTSTILRDTMLVSEMYWQMA